MRPRIVVLLAIGLVGAEAGSAQGRAHPRPSDHSHLKLKAVITGRISPKSAASSGTGYVTAQNMMYRHTITVYDPHAEAGQDDLGRREPGEARPPAVPGHRPRRAGRGGVLAGRPLRLR